MLSDDDRVPEVFRMRADRFRVDADPGSQLAAARAIGATVVCPGDPEWPVRLDDHPVPPLCLWVLGRTDLAMLAERSVSVVGARSSTGYGDTVASGLGSGLAERGWTVVSGAAFGIDAAAHRGALSVDGATVAVVAGGVDRPYPLAHTDAPRPDRGGRGGGRRGGARDGTDAGPGSCCATGSSRPCRAASSWSRPRFDQVP